MMGLAVVPQWNTNKIHVAGRGAYGYANTTETYPDIGKTQYTTFDQRGFPYTGGVLTVTESYNSSTVNELTTTMAPYLEPYPGIYQLNLQQSIQKSYELDNSNSLVTTVTTQHGNIDDYGNIGLVTVTTTGGGQSFTKVTESDYDNDINKWHLGRLTNTTVIHKSPYGNDTQRSSAFEYNTVTGLLDQEKIISSNGSNGLAITTNTYDQYGQKTQVTVSAAGELDRTSTTTYNAIGKPTQSCNVYNQCESYTYTPEGWLASTTGPNGITTSWEYDGFGRKVKENRADGTHTTIQRHFADSGQCGELASAPFDAYTCTVTQASGTQPAIVQYDALGREVRKITQSFDERLVYMDTEYNHLAQVTRVSRDYYVGNHIYWATSEYDMLERIVRVTEPGPHGSTNEINTEYNGLVSTVYSGPEQRAKTTTNNAIGQKVRIDEEEGSYTEYTYNDEGNLLTTRVSGDNSTVITLSYDEFGRKAAMDDPDMGQWIYQYDAFSQLISQTDAKGQTITMDYDLLGRMTSRTEPEGTSTWDYGNNSAPQGSIGKLLSESGNGLTKTYSYDSLGRPTATTTTIAGQGSFTTQTQYDSLGRVKRVVYPGTQGFYTDNVYNDNGFLAAVTGLRSQAEPHDYSALAPLISEATTLADDYIAKANSLRNIGQYYASQISYYQSLSGSGTANSALNNKLTQHQGQLSSTVTQAQNTHVQTTNAQFIPIIMGDILIPLVHQQRTVVLQPEVLEHVNNTIIELQNVNQLISSQAQSYTDIAEQLTVLAEQTLAAADHSFQFADTLDYSAAAYNDFISESNTNTITYWRAVDVDASGRISAEVYGNGITNDYAYNQATGQLQSIHSSLLVVDPIRHTEYQYDAYQNVTLRDDMVNDIRDTYDYKATLI